MSDVYSSLILPSSMDVLQYVVPTSGSTVTANPSTTLLMLDPAGLLASLTVTFPQGPVDGQRFIVVASAIITLLTLNGGTIKGLLTSISANGYARYNYSALGSSWFRSG